MSYKLSIITINYNNSLGLEKTLKSVINQTNQNFEYIVIDGNSSDESKKIIEENKNDIDKWISESDSGVYNAMNKGIEMATGNYLLFLNSGDKLVNTEVISKILPFLDNDLDLIYGNLIYSSDEIPETLFTPPNKLNLTYFINTFLPHPASFIKKKVFYNNGFFNENLKIVSDWEFFLKAIIVHKIQYKHVNQIISDFDYTGISSNSENKNLIAQEKKIVFETLFPNLQNEISLLEFASSRRISQIQNIKNNHPFLWILLKGFLNILNLFAGNKEPKYFQKISKKISYS